MKPIITLEFDDSFKETVKNVLPLLKKYNLKATFAVIANPGIKEIDGINLISKEEIKKIVAEGHEIASHTLNHSVLGKKKIISLRNLKNLIQVKNINYLKKIFLFRKNNKQVNKNSEEEIKESQKNLEKISPVSSITYPGGAYDKKTLQIVKRFYSSGRTVDRGLNSPKSNKYQLKAMLWDKKTSKEESSKWIKKTIKEKKWLIEVFHLVAENNKKNYEYFTNLKIFEEHLKILRRLKDKGIIEIKKRNEIY